MSLVAPRAASPARAQRSRRGSYSEHTGLPRPHSRFAEDGAPRSRRSSVTMFASASQATNVALPGDGNLGHEIARRLGGGFNKQGSPMKEGRSPFPELLANSNSGDAAAFLHPPLGEDKYVFSKAPVVDLHAPTPAAQFKSLQESADMAKAVNDVITTSMYHEHAYWVEEASIEGTIPEGLRGTLIRNGPALFDFAADNPHMMEGDGMVYSFSFDGEGGVWFNNKFVRTEAFVEERTEGVQCYRQVFNSKLPEKEKVLDLNLPVVGKVQVADPRALRFKDNASINAVHWGGKNVILYEMCTPYLMSNDLETLGPTSMDGSLKENLTGAHTRMVKEPDGSSRLVMFGANYSISSSPDCDMFIREFDEQFNLVNSTDIDLPGGANGMYHDITVTENYYVFVQNRLSVDFAKILSTVFFGAGNMFQIFNQHKDLPTRVHLVPRPGKAAAGTGVRTFDVPGASLFTFHHSNGYEIDADGSTPASKGETGDFLVMDILSARRMDFDTGEAFTGPEHFGDVNCRTDPYRLVINLKDPSAPVSCTKLADRMTEVPALHPGHVGRPHEHIYCATSTVTGGDFFGIPQGIVKTSTSPMNGVGSAFNRQECKESFWFPDSKHLATYEPTFVPRAGGTGAEDDGFLLVMVVDSETRKTELVILDAQNLPAGPVARIKLAHHMVPGLHGMWASEYMGPPKGTPSRPARDIRDGI